MRPRGSQSELENRRLEAVELLKQGSSLRAAARRLGCHASSVMRWWRAYQAGGDGGLVAKYVAGRPRRLTEEQQLELGELLRLGPYVCLLAPAARWTNLLVVKLIRKKFGVQYHPAHAGRILRRFNLPKYRRRRLKTLST